MAHLTTDDGVKLYYEESGTGIPIVFVHEFAGAPLQTGNDTSIKRTSFNRARERFA